MTRLNQPLAVHPKQVQRASVLFIDALRSYTSTDSVVVSGDLFSKPSKRLVLYIGRCWINGVGVSGFHPRLCLKPHR